MIFPDMGLARAIGDEHLRALFAGKHDWVKI
jgi:hypothetical protein